MKKILYIWKDRYPWDVRVEKFCKTFVGEGWNTFLLARSRGSKIERENIDGISVIRAGCNKSDYKLTPVPYNFWWNNAIESAIKEIKPDIIIVREILLAINAGNLAKKYNIPIILDMAEHYPAAMKNWKKYSKGFWKILVHFFDFPTIAERKALKLMDGIVTVCDEQIERLGNSYGYDSSNCCVVHNVPGAGQYKGVRMGSRVPPVVFGHHGYISGDKKLTTLMKGFSLACRDYPDIKLIIAGFGESFTDLETLKDELEYGSRITLSGAYTVDELPRILGKIDIGVIPYQVSDFNNHTVHNKFFDFLACGKPMIVSMNKPLMRLINQTQAGIIADCSSPEGIFMGIKKIMDSNITRMTKDAIEHSHKYTWEIEKEKLIKFVEKNL